MKFEGTRRIINVDPYDKDKIFVNGFTLDNGNITVWVNEDPENEVSQPEAKNNAEMIVKAFELAQKFGSVQELENRYIDAINALKMSKSFIENTVKNNDHDPVLNACTNRAIKKDEKIQNNKS